MKKILGLSLVVGLFISSCNMPASGTAGSTDCHRRRADRASCSRRDNAACKSHGRAIRSRTATKAVSTPTYSQPMASVEDVTNCRKGPGTRLTNASHRLMPLESVKIIGFFPPNYWVVSTKDGDCWLSGEFATPSGSFAAVPTVTAPPTPARGHTRSGNIPQKWLDIFLLHRASGYYAQLERQG